MLTSATLLGSSSGRNAGDAALISGIMNAVDHAIGAPLRYEIPTIRPGYIRDNYPNHTVPISMMPWSGSLKMLGLPTLRSVLRTDITLIFDAILFDRSLFNPLFNFMSSLHLMLPYARRKGKRMACYNVGTGPVTTPTGRRMLRELAELMDFITVRDRDSFDILQDIGVQNPRILITADAALNAPASDRSHAEGLLKGLGLPVDGEILGININAYLDTWAGPNITPMGREKFLAAYAAALNRVLAEIRAPTLFVCTQHLDVDITRELMRRVRSPERMAIITNREHNHCDIKAVLARLALLFGMRLHCMILSSSEHTPVVGLAYQPKNQHYFNTLELPDSCMGFENFSEDQLYRHLMRGWERRAEIRAHLDRVIPVLQQRALQGAELVAALHRGEDSDRAFRAAAARAK
ncbi:MAG: polysaccharide pyruvyl transferase family protein [Kiritimatiellae bacterium]|nr:polysaccharide pyruvyl transferase family protein [Kiritimatiellia bacterium]